MTGFFPIMMFALPAAALAIVHTSKAKNRKVIAGIMGSAALVSFVTGVTEPLEFAFVYVAYPLYVIHAILTGTSLALVNALGIKDGFGFSAGRHRLPAELPDRDDAAAADRDRPRLRGRVLLPVPVRHHALAAADAGPRGRRRPVDDPDGRGPADAGPSGPSAADETAPAR